MKNNNPYNARDKKVKNKNKLSDYATSDVSSNEKLLQRSSRFVSTASPTTGRDIKVHEDDTIFVPSCTEMCSIAECVEREGCLDVHPLEADDMNGSISYEAIAANVHRKIDPAKAVKKFRRPAAGAPPPKASEIRTPETIMKTLAFLMSSSVLGRADVPLSVRAAFIRDRGRALRADLSRQVKKGREAIIVGLAMARFHALIAHELCEEDRSDFDPFQNGEQLSKTLTTLGELVALMQHPMEVIEFKAMKILTQIEDTPLRASTMTTPPSGVEAWAYSLLAAFHTKDASGWIRRAIAGPPNCSKVTALVLSSFAQAHMNRMRLMLLEQLHASFSAPVSQSILIADLLVPFGFADIDEAATFFSQFECSYVVEMGPFLKFSKEFSFPETTASIRSKLFDAKLTEIAPSHSYEDALILAITAAPDIGPLVISPSISDPQLQPIPPIQTQSAPPKSNFCFMESSAPKVDLSRNKDLIVASALGTIDITFSANVSKKIINETICTILRPFIASALRRRASYISECISKHIMVAVYKEILMDQFICSFRKHTLMKKVLFRWRKFIATTQLSSRLLPLLSSHSGETENPILLKLPLLSQGRLLEFHSSLFGDCKFSPLPLRIVFLDWSTRACIPPLNICSTDAEISILSIYRCKNVCSEWVPPQFNTKFITLILVLVEESTVKFNAICKQLKALRSTSIRDDVDLLFIAFIVKREESNARRFAISENSQITRERISKLVGVSSFHVNLFHMQEINENLLIDWIRPSLSLLLIPGGTAWIESNLIFQEISNSVLIEAVIDSDFTAFLCEAKAPTIELWRSSKWYRRYVIVDVAKMQAWERGI
ncbi:actin cytoskeleton and mitosis protein [Mitosporidium daphniae]|uniref:SAC3/GANP/THP3 conserved domain-containing protein n=1 Tax=Mitosporidium daphniae TaxID=1485682 RepID=A0A098VRX4_9MICR|nr:uncharacterized protein DI09_31p200 [Mitosporidium daphniae]KGG51569.1 hypothetical protein DI09_31p200 [Mitosporidium daphniae]|eukprot:XP_013237996.1 uncharacterized protein DI09_31p200 [Mitosporidium daphniae]